MDHLTANSRDARAAAGFPGTIDLHCHSTASDGRLTPAALVQHARAAGIDTLALTDHDTVAGLAPAAAMARAEGLHFITGVELSVTWSGKTLHVVGLGIDPDAPSLSEVLRRVQDTRASRAALIAARVEKLGVHNALARAQAAAGGGQITRTHFARLLVEDGVAADLKQAFKKHLGAGKPAQVRGEWLALEESVTAIRAAGGVAVLAHPLRYKLTAAWRERMLSAFVAAGGQGVEVSAGGSQQPTDLALMREAARRYGLLGSVGSDFHGPEQRWLRYGRLAALPHDITPVWTHGALSNGRTSGATAAGVRAAP